MTALVLALVSLAGACGVAFWRGWRAGAEAGRRAGDLAHARCHRDAANVVDTLLEAVDMAAWEEEL